VHHAVLLPDRQAESRLRVGEPGSDAPIRVREQVGIALVENARANEARAAKIELRRVVQRHVGRIPRQCDQIGAGADQRPRGHLQQPLVGAAVTDMEVRVPAEEAGRGLAAAIAHSRLERESGLIEGEAHGEVDRKRIARPLVDRGAQCRPCASGIRGELGDVKVVVAHETVAALPLSGGRAGLQIVLPPIEAIARLGDTARKGHHDGEARARTGDDLGGIAVRCRDVDRAATASDFEADERGAMAGDAYAPAGIVAQRHDRLIAQQ